MVTCLAWVKPGLLVSCSRLPAFHGKQIRKQRVFRNAHELVVVVSQVLLNSEQRSVYVARFGMTFVNSELLLMKLVTPKAIAMG